MHTINGIQLYTIMFGGVIKPKVISSNPDPWVNQEFKTTCITFSEAPKLLEFRCLCSPEWFSICKGQFIFFLT